MIEVVTTGADVRISDLAREFSVIKAAVAYWCFPQERLSPEFVRGICAYGGYLCCDYHLPTSITVLTRLKSVGANVYLYLYNLVGRTEVPDSKGVPDHLMHSKILIFEHGSQDECAIWIGSHNGTARALMGINFECALVVRCSKQSDLYRGVLCHLDAIRARCTEFDLRDVEYYRSLQQQPDGLVTCIEVYTEAGLQPAPGEELSLFGTNSEDFTPLRSVDRDGVLSVTDRSSGVEHLFTVQITQSGRLNPENPRAVALSRRRYAFHENSLPELKPEGAIPRQVYLRSKFFVTLRVETVLTDKVAVELPPREQWVNVPLASYLRDATTDSQERVGVLNLDLPSGRSVSIQRAVSRSDPALPIVLQREFDRAMLALPLEERAALPRQSIVRKRLLRAGTPDHTSLNN